MEKVSGSEFYREGREGREEIQGNYSFQERDISRKAGAEAVLVWFLALVFSPLWSSN
jgi:hypothetical protein